MTKENEKLTRNKILLNELYLYLQKQPEEVMSVLSLETIIEGFWQQKYKQALEETKPFELKGDEDENN